MNDLMAVVKFQAEYAYCIDSDELERWPDFFTADGLYRITNALNENRGMPIGIVHAAGQPMMRDRITSLRKANVFEAQRYRHLLSLPRLLDNGRAVTGFMVVRIMHDGTTDLFATGEYRDVITEDAGELKFSERVVVLDSERVDTLLAIPL